MHGNNLQEIILVLQGAQIERLNKLLTQSKQLIYSTDSLSLSSSIFIKDQSIIRSKYQRALQQVQRLQDAINTLTQQKMTITSQLNQQLKENRNSHEKQISELEQQLRTRTQQYKYIIDSKQAQIRSLNHEFQQLQVKYHQLQTKIQSSATVFHEQLLNTLGSREQRILYLQGQIQKLKKFKYQQTVEQLSQTLKLFQLNKLQQKNKQHFKIKINQILSRLDRIIVKEQRQIESQRREKAGFQSKIRFLSGELHNKEKLISLLKEENHRLRGYFQGNLHKLGYKFSL